MNWTSAAAPGPDTSTRVKILVVGEAGVGKTSLVQTLCGRSVRSAPWTVGCSVEVLVHPFRQGTHQEKPFFVELWDVGGSRSHRAGRRVFYQGAAGVILVYDLGNRKSEETLQAWLTEVSGFGGLEAVVTPTRVPTTGGDESQLPVLVVGSKADLTGGGEEGETGPRKLLRGLASAESIQMDCRHPISPGSTNGLKVARFFDRAILDYCRKTPGMGSATGDQLHPSSLYDRSHRRI